MSNLLSTYIIALVVINIVGALALLLWTKNMHGDESADGKMNHSYDGIEEYNKPLPRWWLNLFYITIVFAVVYLILYPGLGNFAGTLGWTQANAWQKEVDVSNEKLAPLYAGMMQKSVEELANDSNARAIGQRLFANNCSVCHGSDAKGAIGFPNLTDKDWLYGGSGDAIKQSILNGRNGAMPAFGGMLDDKARQAVKHYVLSLSGREHDQSLANTGTTTFNTVCAACHGPDGKGNVALGAPNLTDEIWLFGGTHNAIDDTLKNGRNGRMPAHADILGEQKAHVVAAYVYSLSAAATH